MKFLRRGMNCEKYINLMSRYIDGELSDEERSAWEKHFSACAACHDFFRSFQSSIELLAYLEEKSCPLEVSRRVRKVLEEKLESSKSTS